jgi:hypothetical protein
MTSQNKDKPPKKKTYNEALEFRTAAELLPKVEQAIDDLLKSPPSRGSTCIFSQDVASRVMDNENTSAVSTSVYAQLRQIAEEYSSENTGGRTTTATGRPTNE